MPPVPDRMDHADAHPDARESMLAIAPAAFPHDTAVVQQLFGEYVASLGIDLGFQGIDDELASLPGKYAAPAGRILLARDGHAALGCVALRPMDNCSCEMKRLFVKPQARGNRLGRQLAIAICQAARDAGYGRIYLDTLDSMAAAIALYRSLGFVAVEAYTFNPLPGALYFAREL